jgi:hypothetical protein
MKTPSKSHETIPLIQRHALASFVNRIQIDPPPSIDPDMLIEFTLRNLLQRSAV